MIVDAEREDDGYSSDLAHWLEDSGRRRAVHLHESPEQLLAHLEKLAGRSLRSREEIAIYLDELKDDGDTRARSETTRSRIRQVVLLVVLAGAIAQYYYWDVNLLIVGLQKVHYFVKARSRGTGTRRRARGAPRLEGWWPCRSRR